MANTNSGLNDLLKICILSGALNGSFICKWIECAENSKKMRLFAHKGCYFFHKSVWNFSTRSIVCSVQCILASSSEMHVWIIAFVIEKVSMINMQFLLIIPYFRWLSNIFMQWTSTKLSKLFMKWISSSIYLASHILQYHSLWKKSVMIYPICKILR